MDNIGDESFRKKFRAVMRTFKPSQTDNPDEEKNKKEEIVRRAEAGEILEQIKGSYDKHIISVTKLLDDIPPKNDANRRIYVKNLINLCRNIPDFNELL